MPRNTGYVLPFTCELFICGISSLVEVCTVLIAILVVVISYVVVLFCFQCLRLRNTSVW